MKATRWVAVGAWMVDHLTFGLTNEALSGDLLEEIGSGQSRAWYWRQVCFATGTGLFLRLRDLTLPLIFCLGWTSLYPFWNLLSKAVIVQLMPRGWTHFGWPWSALLPLGYGLVPALTFVWLGFFLYVLLSPWRFYEVAARRLLWGVSASLNVLLISTQLLLWHFKQSRVDLDSLMRTDFYSAFHLLSISIPLALSLISALVCAGLGTHRRTWRRRPQRLESV